MQTLKIIKKDDRAVIHQKVYPTDVGINLTCITECKRFSDNIIMYDTGICVSPPHGYYVEIIPRSSLASSGYVLANSIGIIDPTYTGTLKIVLVKVDTTSAERIPLTLPFTKCQMVMRRLVDFQLEVVSSLENTERSDGGFGSTDKK